MSRRQLRNGHVRGFSLIEILVVITIIGILVGLAVPAMQNVQENARVTNCQSNLRQIAQGLLAFKNRNNNNWPGETGIRFFLCLAKYDAIDKKDMGVFICPGTSIDNQGGEAYKDWDSIDSTMTSYAGRDTKNHPIKKSREGDEVIVGDDNEGGDNHRTQTVFVYADAVPKFFDRKIDAEKRGIVFDDELPVVVGSESEVEELKKLQID
jgi:prepilin-type N-terminal cleavage/methylation domain-containing protein